MCTGDNIEYWKKLFQNYLNNTACNDRVYFLQQQEAHEMEFTERFAVFPSSHIEACAGTVDLFFAHITKYPITLTTLPKAIEEYHQVNRVTAPVYMLTEDTLVRPEVNGYTATLGGTAIGPWPQTFLYDDHECQLVFVHGQCGPDRLRSYVGKGNMADEFEEATPQVFVSGYEKAEHRIRMTFEIEPWQPMPFGLTYWDMMEDYSVESCSDGVDARMIGGELVFLRFRLTGNAMAIELSLVKKE